MASIEKRPAGGYRVRWRERGKARSRGGIPTKKDAEAVKRRIEAAVALGDSWRPDTGA